MFNGGIYFVSLICAKYVKLSLIFTFCEIYNTALSSEQIFKLNQMKFRGETSFLLLPVTLRDLKHDTGPQVYCFTVGLNSFNDAFRQQ